MSTRQKQIRAFLFAAISAGVPTGTTVHQDRRKPLEQESLPSVTIFSVSDRPAEEDVDHGRPHMRVYTLRAECITTGRPDDDATDDLAEAVRVAVFQDQGCGGLAERIGFSGQQWDGAELEEAYAATALDFAVTYLHEVNT